MTARGWALFLTRRLLGIAVLLLCVSFLIFALLALAPGDPVNILLGETPRSGNIVQQLNHQYHLDQPFYTQYWIWLKQASHLNFGSSIYTTLPVTKEIEQRLPTSIFLGVYAFVLTMLFGLTLGLVAGIKRNSRVDRGVVAGAMLGLGCPAFVTGIALIYLFSITLKWFPVYGRGSGFTDELWHLTLPAFAMAITTSAAITRQTRAAILGVVDQDYITFARALGLSRPRIWLTYILRTALVPIATISTLLLSGLIVGAALAEAVFSIPGVGGLLVSAASNQDIPVLQGVGMLVATSLMCANLLADILYMIIDPRIRAERA